MASLALVLAPTPGGWAVRLTNGVTLACYRGLWAKRRAMRHLQRYVKNELQPYR